MGCGAGGTPTGRLMVPTAGGAGWRPVPAEPPPDTETPRQPPGHFGRRPNWANAAGKPPPDSGALCARPLPSGRRRVATGADGWLTPPAEPPPDTETPASLPVTLRDGPTGQTPPGNPPPDSGALCVRPLPSGRRRRRSAPGGDTAQRVRVVCRFEKVTYRCSPRTESFSARRLSATRSCTCWQISTRCSRAASSSSPRRFCLGRAICL